MRLFFFITLYALFLLKGNTSEAQSVGVVLSGGGASGMAHIGVLKALEENAIPIDYITGTSIGAFVGGLYAAGYSPDEIEVMLTSDKFRKLAEGQIESKYVYYFRKPYPNASWISLRLRPDSNTLQTILPTSFINPGPLDIEMMKLLEPASQRANYNFDSLFVPFRCVASDIANKESVLFSSGNLNRAIRASMSYPLYLEPLRIDEKLLFDGGLYNNFPTDIMRDEFQPDVIIGSNVSSNEGPPRDDDAISQLMNMVVSKTNYYLDTTCCILIEPTILYGTFDFKHASINIDSGYSTTIRQMPDIKNKVHRRVHRKVVDEKRREFNKSKIELKFSEIEFEGLTKAQSAYVGLLMKPKKNKDLSFSDLKKSYYRLQETDKVRRIFPYPTGLASDSTYALKLEIKKEKNLLVEIGGNLSSRPINTGYVGLGYSTMNNTGSSFYANTYFGKLYTSAMGLGRIDLPLRFPMYFELKGVLNRWNYYKSRASFFEDNNSLFLIQNETFIKGALAFAVSNKTKIYIDAGPISLKDDYYQTADFTEFSTKDITIVRGWTYSAVFERNSLNAKQYANGGSLFSASARFSDAIEDYNPGSTSPDRLREQNPHSWIVLKTKLDHYYKSTGNIRLGIFAEGVYSNMRLFTNYTASQLQSPAFLPTPESQTLFLETYRAYKYGAVGHKIIFNVYKNFDLRLEGYYFKPFSRANLETIRDDEGDIVDYIFERRDPALIDEKYYVYTTLNLVYKSPLGPISVSSNYYLNIPEIATYTARDFTFFFHFGYILFNEKALQ